MKTRLVCCGSLALVALLIVGCRTSDDRATAAAATVTAGTNQVAPLFPAHFEAEVYEVQATRTVIEAKTLERQAAAADSMLKALSKAGTARVLYRFDQQVNVFSDSLMLSSREPIVTASRRGPRGEAINSFQYQQVGAIFRLSGLTPAKAKTPQVTLSAELSVLAKAGADLAPGLASSATRSLSLEHTEMLEFGRPHVMLASSSASPDEKQAPQVYLIRYKFSR